MSHRHVQHLLAGAVVNGQLHLDLGDGDIPHDPGTGNVQRIRIAGYILVAVQGSTGGLEPLVVILCGLEHGAVILLGHAVHGFVVPGNGVALMLGVQVIADSRIEHHGESHKKKQDENERGDPAVLFLFCCLQLMELSLMLTRRGFLRASLDFHGAA